MQSLMRDDAFELQFRKEVVPISVMLLRTAAFKTASFSFT
jgi:hypothetical protein